jgi:hypothetical protein
LLEALGLEEIAVANMMSPITNVFFSAPLECCDLLIQLC